MRITYRTLSSLIERMTDSQKDSEVTVDIWSIEGVETYGAEFRIVNDKHENLEVNHPVITVNQLVDLGPLVNDVDWIAKSIGIDKSDTEGQTNEN
jgi:hypothetical protein